MRPGHTVITISRDEFARAVQLHQAGELDAAARLYESVLNERSRLMPTLFISWECCAISRANSGLAAD